MWNTSQFFGLFAEKIKDLFPENSLSSSTKLVLINAIYLKGKWDKEFKKENTKEEEFWLNKVWSFIESVCLYIVLVTYCWDKKLNIQC